MNLFICYLVMSLKIERFLTICLGRLMNFKDKGGVNLDYFWLSIFFRSDWELEIVTVMSRQWLPRLPKHLMKRRVVQKNIDSFRIGSWSGCKFDTYDFFYNVYYICYQRFILIYSREIRKYVDRSDWLSAPPQQKLTDNKEMGNKKW